MAWFHEEFDDIPLSEEANTAAQLDDVCTPLRGASEVATAESALPAASLTDGPVPALATPRRKLVFAPDQDVIGDSWSGSNWQNHTSKSAISAEGVNPANATQKLLGATPEQLESIDRENDLKHSLKQRWSVREKHREEFEAELYELHQLMAGTGREGKFTPFLRDELGWDSKRAYRKAMRGIARHKCRVGLITRAELQKVYGNNPTSTPLRGTSEPNEETTDSVSPTVSFTFEVEEDADAAPLKEAEVSAEEVAAADALDGLGAYAATVRLQRRIVLPAAKIAWLDSGLKVQMRRHGARNFPDLLWKLALCGPKAADPEDEWGTVYDEILRSVGMNAESALVPDPDFENPEEVPE